MGTAEMVGDWRRGMWGDRGSGACTRRPERRPVPGRYLRLRHLPFQSITYSGWALARRTLWERDLIESELEALMGAFSGIASASYRRGMSILSLICNVQKTSTILERVRRLSPLSLLCICGLAFEPFRQLGATRLGAGRAEGRAGGRPATGTAR